MNQFPFNISNPDDLPRRKAFIAKMRRERPECFPAPTNPERLQTQQAAAERLAAMAEQYQATPPVKLRGHAEPKIEPEDFESP